MKTKFVLFAFAMAVIVNGAFFSSAIAQEETKKAVVEEKQDEAEKEKALARSTEFLEFILDMNVGAPLDRLRRNTTVKKVVAVRSENVAKIRYELSQEPTKSEIAFLSYLSKYSGKNMEHSEKPEVKDKVVTFTLTGEPFGEFSFERTGDRWDTNPPVEFLRAVQWDQYDAKFSNERSKKAMGYVAFLATQQTFYRPRHLAGQFQFVEGSAKADSVTVECAIGSRSAFRY